MMSWHIKLLAFSCPQNFSFLASLVITKEGSTSITLYHYITLSNNMQSDIFFLTGQKKGGTNIIYEGILMYSKVTPDWADQIKCI